MRKAWRATILGVFAYVLALLLLCLADRGSIFDALRLAAAYLVTSTFAKELLIVMAAVALVFFLASFIAFLATPFRFLRDASKATAVLLKVTPALALTPVLRRALPHGLSMGKQVLLATVVTGILIGFYPIFSTAVEMYEEALRGSPGEFARTIGASRGGAHVYILSSYLLRGALIGSVTGFPLTVIGIIVGEMIVASDVPNIGYQIMTAVQSGRTGTVIAAVLASTVLGLFAYLLGCVAAAGAAALGEEG